MLTGRRCGGTGTMSSPPRKMRPSLGVSKPASIRSNVVLPQPDGPSSAKNSPWAMSKLSASTAATAPKRLLTASKRISGALPPVLWSAPPVAIDSPFAAHTLAARADRSTRRRRMSACCGQGSSHRLLPARIFPLALARIHARLEAAVEPPLFCESGKVGANSGGATGEICGTYSGRLQHRRPVDRTCEDVGKELHARVARGHPAVDAQHSLGL